MPTPKGIKTQGTTLHYSIGSPTLFVKVGRVLDFDGPGGDSAVVDDTDLDDLEFRRKFPGLADAGQFNVRLGFDPDSASHEALRQAQAEGTILEIKVTLPRGTKKNLYFDAFVRSFRLAGPADARVGGSISLEIDGGWRWAT